MTKRDFFLLMIKLFGLYSAVITLFSLLPRNMYYGMAGLGLDSILWVFFTGGIIIGLFVMLVFRSEEVLSRLKLDQGFDEERIELGNLDATAIIKVATFILGGIIFLESIPEFLNYAFHAIVDDIEAVGYRLKDSAGWAISGLNIVVGYWLLTRYRTVAEFFTRAQNKTQRRRSH